MKANIKTICSVSLIVLATLFTILLDFMDAQFSTEIFTNVGYWLDVATVQTAVIVILFSARSLSKDKERKTHSDYVKLQSAIEEGYWDICAKDLNKTFGDYIDRDNRARKLTAYTEMLNKKIAKYTDRIVRADFKLKRLSLKRRPLLRPILFRVYHGKKERSSTKKEYFEAKLSRAGEEVDYVKVKYIRYSYAILFRNARERADEQNDPYPHEWRDNAHVLFMRALSILAIGFIATSQFNPTFTFSWFMIYKAIIKLFQIFFGIYSGAASGQEFIQTTMCSKLAIRLNYVKKFIEENSTKIVTAEEEIKAEG